MTFEENLRQVVREVLREELRPLLETAQARSAARPADDGGAYLSTAKAAALAGVRSETIRAWVAGGKLPGHRAGRHLRVRRDELETMMALGGSTPAGHSGAVDLKHRARAILAGQRVEED